MPLVGIVDPSHWERAHAKSGRIPYWYTVDELLLESQNPNPKWAPWMFEMVQAVIGEHQERGGRLSTTSLTAPCPRAAVLERMVDYVGTLDSEYAALRGTMVHQMLEKYARLGSIAEARFFTTIDDIEISCSPDLLTPDAVYDYKVTDSPPGFGYPYRHHTEQVELNAYICRHAEKWELPPSLGQLPFDPREQQAQHAVIVYLGPKAPKVIEVQRKDEFQTPTGVWKEAKLPYIWSDDEVLKEFRPRLHLMREALDNYPDFPEGAEEVWGGKPGWKCPGPPICNLPNCLARREPDMYTWERGKKATRRSKYDQ